MSFIKKLPSAPHKVGPQYVVGNSDGLLRMGSLQVQDTSVASESGPSVRGRHP